jgi:non-specific serine/threonine protein kinase
VGNDDDAIWTFGEVRFDEAAWDLRVAGTPIRLERKPLELLGQLVRHPGEILTKDELFEAVWPGRVVVEGALTNAVAKLRRAIDDAAQDVVEVVPRLGYRLNAQVTRVPRELTVPAVRLAPGDGVPRRPGFRLVELLGGHGGIEVWRARQPRTGEARVFKIACGGLRLASLKREVTVARLLREALGARDDLVALLDWDFDNEPCWVEFRDAGERLDAWGARHPDADRAQRLDFAARIADVVAKAHEAGVLHKDIKPGNVLVAGSDGDWQVRLADFGSSGVLDPARLEALGITRMGLTDLAATPGREGTLDYLAPEILAGGMPTTRSDLYSLGLLVYQLLVGDFRARLLPGWEQPVADELLAADIARATHQDPDQRFASAADLARCLRTLEDRRARAAWDEATTGLAAARQAKQRRMKQAARPLGVGIGLLILGTTLLTSAGFTAQFESAAARGSPAWLTWGLAFWGVVLAGLGARVLARVQAEAT